MRDLSDLLLSFALHNLKKGVEYYDKVETLLMLAKIIQKTPNDTLKVEVRDRLRGKIDEIEEGEPEREKLQAKYNEIYL